MRRLSRLVALIVPGLSGQYVSTQQILSVDSASFTMFLDLLLASGSGYPDMARSVPVDPGRTRAGTGTALTAPRKVSRLQLTAGGLKVICNPPDGGREGA